MIITNKIISRRSVLRGMGSMLALPLLDAMTPALAAQGKTRMLGCFLEPPRSIAYAAQLNGLCDWTDLDGHFWLTEDPAVPAYRLDSTRPGIPTIDYSGVCEP